MSQSVTEREAVLREREAVNRAAVMVMAQLRCAARGWDGGGGAIGATVSPNYPVVAQRFVESLDFRRLADDVCPLPKVERPRVVTDQGAGANGPVRWRVVNGGIEWQSSGAMTSEWNPLREARFAGMFITAERVLLLAKLLADPTELVEDEGQ